MSMSATAKRFDTKPLYAQVQEELASRILSRAYAAGDPLPNEWMLSTELGVSIGTLRKAVQALVDGGLLVRIAGRGTIVTDRQSRTYKAMFERFRDRSGKLVQWSYELLDIQDAFANAEEAEKLQIAVGAPVTHLLRTRTVNGRKVMLERIHLPAQRILVAPAIPPDQSTIESLSEANGRAIGSIVKSFTIERPTDEALAFLDSQGAVLMNFERLAYDNDDMPIEWCRGCVDWANLSFVTEIRPAGRGPRRT